jgi:molecular chaperone IbpA
VKRALVIVSGASSYPTCSQEDLAMRYDWTPLWRSTVGFDRLFDAFDEVQKASEDNYPLYNIERLDQDRFQISVALAGFSPGEITLTAEQNVLTLEGRKAEKQDRAFLYRGISARPFKRQFTLADHVEVKNARFENGLLVIDLVREIPEAMKPRKVEINAAASSNVNQIEAKAA